MNIESDDCPGLHKDFQPTVENFSTFTQALFTVATFTLIIIFQCDIFNLKSPGGSSHLLMGVFSSFLSLLFCIFTFSTYCKFPAGGSW